MTLIYTAVPTLGLNSACISRAILIFYLCSVLQLVHGVTGTIASVGPMQYYE